jgi:CBS domain-containing protein
MTSELSIKENAKRVCIYIGESDRWRGRALYIAILETLKIRGMAGATVTRGVAGFGAHSRIHTAAILRLSEDLPLRIEVIDSAEKIEKALEVIAPMVREGLITMDDVQVIRYTHRFLNPLPVDKPIKDVMTSEVILLHPEMPIVQAWQMMLDHIVKAMPVVDENQQVIGMLTDEDLIERAGVQQHLSVAIRIDETILNEQLKILQSSPLKVADVMTKPAITVQVNDSLGVAAGRMAKYGIKRLPVVDDSGKLVGVVARIDVLRLLTNGEAAKRKFQPPSGALQTLQQVMYAEAPTVTTDANLGAIVGALVETGLRRVIVVDAQDRPIGLISDSDVVSRIQPRERRGVLAALRGGPAPASKVVAKDLMSPGVLSARPDYPLIEAAREMLEQKRKWLVVVDEDGKTMGLVDRQIVLKALTMG